MFLGHGEAVSLASVAGRRGLGVVWLVWGVLVFPFKLSAQKTVFKFGFYHCVFGRNFYQMISGLLGVTNWYKEVFSYRVSR